MTRKDQDSPLLIVVEDDDQQRQQRVRHFSRKGFVVIGASSMDHALRELRASPGIDLILTDIELDTLDPNKSGVALAREVRERQFELPIAGYSAKFDELPEADQAQFAAFQKKGALDRRQRDEFAGTCLGLAEEHRKRRRDQVERSMDQLRRNDAAMGAQFETLRSVVMDRERKGAEETLERAGYRILLIEADSFDSIVAPFVVWIRQRTDEVEAEVYGQPELYNHGSNADEAVRGLIELMGLSAAALRDGRRCDLTHQAKQFLLRVVGQP